MNKKHTIRCAVYLFLIRDNKLLLLRRKNTGWKDGQYGVPAGHLEKNETVLSAATREAKEETGIDIKPEDLELVHVMHRKANYDYIDFYFNIKKWKGDPFIAEKEKSDDLQWFDLDKLPQNTVDYVRMAFENSRNKILFSQFGW